MCPRTAKISKSIGFKINHQLRLPFSAPGPISYAMKVIACVFLVLCFTGCAGSSKHSSNPGAAVVGPGYLYAIADYPRDRDTQYYYPGFGIRNFEFGTNLSTPLPQPDLSPKVAALLTYIPEPSQKVKDITGKGYPELERTGIQLFTGPAQQ